VAVVGDGDAGKTHYIIALHEWWNDKLGDFRYSAAWTGTETDHEVFKRIVRKVVGRRQRAHTTLSTAGTNAFIWDFRSSLRGRFRAPRPFYFFYHDTAGEHLTNPRTNYEYSGYVIAADMLLLVIDGERLQVVRNRLYPGGTTAEPVKDEPPSGEAADDDYSHLEADLPPGSDAQETAASKEDTILDASEGLENLIRLLREQTNAKEGRIPIPIAVCINKSDSVAKVMETYKQTIERRPEHDGYFDLPTCDAASNAIEEHLIEELKQGSLVQKVRAHFVDHMFFATSTLGSGPDDLRGRDDQERYAHWAPLGVEDPFLWILWKLGRIPARET